MTIIILYALIFFLFFLVIRQSNHIKKTVLSLGYLKGEIKKLKNQVAELYESHSEVTPPEIKKRPAPSEKMEKSGTGIITQKSNQRINERLDLSEDFKPEKTVLQKYKKSETVQADSGKGYNKPAASFNWENFLGAKMFAWIGGLSLFIGFAFLLKFSLDHNLISPAVRISAGFLSGAALVIGGIYLKQKTYEVTSQTLCATGIVILYASNFAAGSVYNYIGTASSIALMSIITAGAFLLSVKSGSKVIAVLGIVGGFLTWPILSTGYDQTFALFTYITFLNSGLICVAFYKKWNFLIALGAAGTVLTEAGWVIQFFSPEKYFASVSVFLWFNLMFCAVCLTGKKFNQSDKWLNLSAVSIPFVTLLFSLYLIMFPNTAAVLTAAFSCMLGADLCLAAVILIEKKLLKYHMSAGGFVFFILSLWITLRMPSEFLIWALGSALVFTFIHSAFPMFIAKGAPSAVVSRYSGFSPLLALLLTLIPLLKGYADSYLIWPFALMINAGVMILAVLTAAAWIVLGALVVSVLVIIAWFFSGAAGGFSALDLVLLIGSFAVVFSVIATFVLDYVKRKVNDPNSSKEPSNTCGDFFKNEDVFLHIPVFSTVLPFILLILASDRLTIESPMLILGAGMFLVFITVWLSRHLKAVVLMPIAMGCMFLLELVIHLHHFNIEYISIYLVAYLLSFSIFALFPFYYRRDYMGAVIPWAAAALSGPIHYFLILDTVKVMFPNMIQGLLPAVFAALYYVGLTVLIKMTQQIILNRNAILTWFGGSVLFFVTVFFPVQFDLQWLTIGWAVEGLVLIMIYKKIPHKGFHGLGAALLAAAFIRLGLNGEVFRSYPLSEFRIFNWYLYTYGTAVICLMSGAGLLRREENRLYGVSTVPVLYTLGTVLAFMLMNIEISDFYSYGVPLRFHFSGGFAQGMTYSIAWALFALGLLITGVKKHLKAVRYAAIALIGVTLIKLFIFDLRQLNQLYRISAFIGVAAVLITSSVIYQKWVVKNHEYN